MVRKRGRKEGAGAGNRGQVNIGLLAPHAAEVLPISLVQLRGDLVLAAWGGRKTTFPTIQLLQRIEYSQHLSDHFDSFAQHLEINSPFKLYNIHRDPQEFMIRHYFILMG